MDRRRIVGIVVIAVLLAGIIAALVSALGGDDDDNAGPGETTTTTLPLGPEATTLRELIEKSRTTEYHVHFVGTSGDPQTAPPSLELWRADGKLRQDVAVGAGEDETRASSFLIDDKAVSCSKQPGRDWTCEEFSRLEGQAGTAAGLVESAAANLGGAEVTRATATIAGREAQCFSITEVGGEKREVCITDEGIPVRVQIGTNLFEADVVETEVDSDAFDLPARVTTPSAPVTTKAG
jgi:hypothetical protein